MESKKKAKVLVIRFSSMGDIVQTFFCLPLLKGLSLSTEIHWATRSDFSELVEANTLVDRVWSLDRAAGARGLLDLARQLRKENFTHVYDAHSNVRSHLLSIILCPPVLWRFKRQFLRRPKFRWKRFLLFNFRLDLYPLPQSMASTYMNPLRKWIQPLISDSAAPPLRGPKSLGPLLRDATLEFRDSILLVPSASAELKRWPTEHWKRLVDLLPNCKFVVAGGPHDHFCKEIANAAPRRVINISGQLSWLQSAWVMSQCRFVVSNDTGLGHLADYASKPTIMLIGPVPFGYPHRQSTKILELSLKCKPCSKHGFDPCRNVENKKCLHDIRPEEVARQIEAAL